MADLQIELFEEVESFKGEFLGAASEIKKTAKNYQERFILLYLANGCKNATQCAKDAGYSPKTAKVQASKLLKKPQVAELIRREKSKLAEELRIDAQFLARKTYKMMRIAEGEISADRFIKIKDGGYISSKKYYDGTEYAKSIEILGKLTGSFSETKNINANISTEDLKNTEDSDILSLA